MAGNDLIKLEEIPLTICGPTAICRSPNFLWITSNSGIYKVDPYDGHQVQLIKICVAMDICYYAKSDKLFALVSISAFRKGSHAETALVCYNKNGIEVQTIMFKTECGRLRKMAIASDGTTFFTSKRDVSEPTKQYSSIWRMNVENLDSSPERIVHHCPHNMFYLAIVEAHRWIAVGDRHDNTKFSLDLYDFNGIHIREISNGTADMGDLDYVPRGKIWWPKGIAVHPSGDVLVIDETNWVSRFDPEVGNFKRYPAKVKLAINQWQKPSASTKVIFTSLEIR